MIRCAPVALALWLLAASAQAQQNPRDLYAALNALRLDPSQVYMVHDLALRRAGVSISLAEGKLEFMTALDGRVTGAIFIGRGRVIAAPREPAEKLSLARFLGVPLLDQSFTRAYFRFTDDTEAELRRQLQEAGSQPSSEATLANAWNPVLPALNPWHSLRIMTDWLASAPQPYFYAGLAGGAAGSFDVLVDQRREEPVLIGQLREVQGARFYDTWASFSPGEAQLATRDFLPLAYTLDTTIHEDLTLDGATTIRLKCLHAGERVVILELSRLLEVQQVADVEGHTLAFFQNQDLNHREILQRGNDAALVVLAQPAREGQEINLQVKYRGGVISDAGNGVFFVGQRGSWYPHLGGPDHFVPFDLVFRWPRKLGLVATGVKISESESGDYRVGHWHPAVPIAVAGFNLGEYAMQNVGDSLKISVYANREIEDAIVTRLRQNRDPLSAAQLLPPPFAGEGSGDIPLIVAAPPPVRPAAVLNELATEILDSVRYFEKLNGPFPFDHLDVSPIPGSFGQGWPGLVYLSTLAYLPMDAQRRAGASQRTQEQLTELMPFHEVAHQWWGNQVGSASYHDSWLFESMAHYLALLYADSRKPGEHVLSGWLEYFRQQLIAKVPGQSFTVEDAGPLSMGYRLSSSKAPDAYDTVIYGKGTWIIHMLRTMLRDPAGKDPDARFEQLLHTVLSEHRFQALSTTEFEHEIERVMPRDMDLEGSRSIDWFFDQWVRETGIPRYSVEFQAHQSRSQFVVRGTLKQSDVSDLFTVPVPLYATRAGGGKPVLIGSVVTIGRETSFRLVTHFAPRRILIDPQNTLLCRTD